MDPNELDMDEAVELLAKAKARKGKGKGEAEEGSGVWGEEREGGSGKAEVTAALASR